MTVFDPRTLRDAFGCFMTGVTVVTTRDAQGLPVGFTANSFVSVSMEPPLLLVSISSSSRNLRAFLEGAGFAVNILSEGQKAVSATFARAVEDRFSTVDWTAGPIGSPVIGGVSAWFDCHLHQVIPAGDHHLLIGRIGAFLATPAPGLGYHRGAYMTPAETAAQVPTGPDVVIAAIVECEGRVLLTDEPRGGLTLPMARVGRDGIEAALSRLIAATGLTATAGTIYAVYEDVARGQQHIAFRCQTQAGRPRQGGFVDFAPHAFDDVGDPAQRAMLDRLAEESRIGNYGVYFGSHESGRVQRTAERSQP